MRALTAMGFFVLCLASTTDALAQGGPAVNEQTKVDDGEKPATWTLYAGGDLLTDLADVDVSKARGQLGMQVLLPNSFFFSIAVNGTDIKNLPPTRELAQYGATLINTPRSAYSVALEAKYHDLGGYVGGYGYVVASATKWQLDVAEPAYSAVPYGFGFGPMFGVRRPINSANTVYFDVGTGLAVRGVGGDVSQRGRLVGFFGKDVSSLAAWEALRSTLIFNIVRASFSLLYVPVRDIEGASDVRLLISVGAAGSIFTL